MFSVTTNLPREQYQQLPETCSNGHRSTLILPTAEGGSICLICLSTLVSNPKSPTLHVSYALSQLSQAISQPQFLHSLLSFHAHFLHSPLVAVLSNFDDEPLAKQVIDLILKICEASNGNGNEDVWKEFVARVSDCLSSGSLAWSRCQLYMLHCLGVLLDKKEIILYASIKNPDALIYNLVTGLQLSSDLFQGEIMFVLYRLFLLEYTDMDDECTDILISYCPKIFRLSLEVLMKSGSDDVRVNCVAFLTVLAHRGFFQNACVNHAGSSDSFEADNFMTTEEENKIDVPFLEVFAEAVKGPLLSSDSQLQIATLDLIFLFLSRQGASGKEPQILVEQNMADYVLEILRLSGCKDPIVHSSLKVLDLLSTAEQSFRQRLAIGFTTLIPILRHVAEIPFHPVQRQLLQLILNCLTNCPGIVSTSNADEISITLTRMFKHIDGEISMLPEAFTLSCSIFVVLMKFSSPVNSSLVASIIDTSEYAVSTCLENNQMHKDQILSMLYLLKEAYAYDQKGIPRSSTNLGLKSCILNLCEKKILPWFMIVINDLEGEDIALGVIETFHSILLQNSHAEAKKFAESLISNTWFSVLFGCLGLFPSGKMKWRVYLIFGSIVDVIFGSDSGQSIRDAAFHLPSDPADLLFLLGQKSSSSQELSCCQSATLQILYISSLYNDRIADDRTILASLEQYILLNNNDFVYGASASVSLELLVNLYGLYRGLAKISYQIPYSPEAERMLFQLLTDHDWDILSFRVHLTSLRWLFQQEKLCKLLSEQLLKFCRWSSTIDHETRKSIDLHVFAELITAGDNLVAMIFICLLGDLIEHSGQDDDITSVISTLTKIIEISPAASNQFCIHGIDDILHNIYVHSKYSYSEICIATYRLVIHILTSAHSGSMSNDEAWVGITAKLLDNLNSAMALDGWSEILLIISILSLILYHSTNQALINSSKTIILSASLVSTINTTISNACCKGPALLDHDEETSNGEALISVLLLLFFSLKSTRTNLPGLLDLRVLIDEDIETGTLSYINIRCHECCRLMYFGSPPIKRIASFCLVELFGGLLNYMDEETMDLKCRDGHMLSVSAVLEGLIYSNDIIVSMNCSQCLSILINSETLGIETNPEQNNWYRLIVEELVMSLVTPSLTSRAFMVHHEPAANIAVALLSSRKPPPWMTNVFDDLSIKSIIRNVTPCNLSPELVALFRELLNSGYLKSENIANLNQMFQACRTHLYSNETRETNKKESVETTADNQDYVVKTRSYLFNIISSESSMENNGLRPESWKEKILGEIELFTKYGMEEDEA